MATYGIDLGTTNSCVAYVDDTGRAVVLKSAVGEDTTPSVVYFESPENVVVGRQAKDSVVLAPDLVARTCTTPSTGRRIHPSRSPR
jgi:molecular chaperone DnaK